MKSCVASRVLPLVLSVSAAGCSSYSGSVTANAEPQGTSLGETSEPLVGTTDTVDKAVLAVISTTASQIGLCTGTLIAPNLVLTARHCVEAVPEGAVSCTQTKFAAPDKTQDIFVSTSTTLNGPAPFYQVSEVHVPPDGSTVCGNDIALLVLARPFAASALQPIAVQLDAPVGKGDSYTAIGFGTAAVDGTEGVRRSKSGQAVVCASSNCASQGTVAATEFVGADSICEGDSGGPAIDDSGSVIGIVSRGADNCGLAIYSAVAPWGSWIDDVAEAAAQTGNYTLPSWFSDSTADTATVVASNAAPSAVAATVSPTASSEDSPAVGPMVSTPESHASAGGGCAFVAPVGGRSEPLPAGLTLLVGLGWVAWRRRPS